MQYIFTHVRNSKKWARVVGAKTPEEAFQWGKNSKNLSGEITDYYITLSDPRKMKFKVEVIDEIPNS